MKTYSEKLKDPRWQKKRLGIMQRDGFKCRECGAADKTLNVHHCFYEGEPWEVNDKFLMTVCDACHEARQELEKDAKKMLGEIMARLRNGQGHEELYIFVSSLSQAARADWKPLVVSEEEHHGLWVAANSAAK